VSLKVLQARIKAPAVSQETTAELERARRELALAKAQAAAHAKDVEDARKASAAAQAERDRLVLEHKLTDAASKARALSPAQVAALMRDRFEVRDGKVLAKDKPDADVDTVVTEWLGSDGKHFLPAAVPSGGSGAPATAGTPKLGAPLDLTTDVGMTAYARELVAGHKARATR